MRPSMLLAKKQDIKWSTHVNPDGSKGGRVASTAQIGSDVTIAKTARILPGATVPDGSVVPMGTFYDKDGPFKLTQE